MKQLKKLTSWGFLNYAHACVPEKSVLFRPYYRNMFMQTGFPLLFTIPHIIDTTLMVEATKEHDIKDYIDDCYNIVSTLTFD